MKTKNYFLKGFCLAIGFLNYFLNPLSVFGAPNVLAWETRTYGSGYHPETNVPPNLTNAVAIAAGSFHSMALRSDGTVVAWGENGSGQTNVPSGLSNVLAIAAGSIHSIALKADGTIVTWGNNTYGQRNTPVWLSNVVAIAGSFYQTIALKTDGTVAVWSSGMGIMTNAPAGLSNVVAVSAGYYNCMALRSDGTVVAIGTGPFNVSDVPADLTNAIAVACSMSASVEHTLALRSDGTVVSWGYNQTNVPPDVTNVFSIAAGNVTFASPGAFRDLALKTDGRMVGWGTVTNIPLNQSNIQAIACGETHELALLGNAPPIQSVQITNPIYSATNFSLQIPTQSGRVYALEFKNSLIDSNWTALPLVAGGGKMITLQDISNTNGQRFYRVRRW